MLPVMQNQSVLVWEPTVAHVTFDLWIVSLHVLKKIIRESANYVTLLASDVSVKSMVL